MTKLQLLRLADAAHARAVEGPRPPSRKPPVVAADLQARATAAIEETEWLRAQAQARRQTPPLAQPHMVDFIAHDLANDLGAAQMCLAALQQNEPALRLGASSDYLGMLQQSLAHMEQLVADLRDARQMQLGRFVLSPSDAV